MTERENEKKKMTRAEKVQLLLHELNESGNRAKALTELVALFENDKFTKVLFAANNLVPTVVRLFIDLQDNADQHQELLADIVEILGNLALNKENCFVLCHADASFLPAFVKLMRTNGDLQEEIEQILSSCVTFPENHAVLFKAEVGYLKYLKSRLFYYDRSQEDDTFNPITQLTSIVKELQSEKDLEPFITLQIPHLIVKQFFQFSSDAVEWETHSINNQLFSFLIAFTSFPSGAKTIKSLLSQGNSSFLFQLVSTKSMGAIKTSLFLANLYGQENDGSNNLLEELNIERIISLLITLLDIQCNFYENREIVKDFIVDEHYEPGELSLQEILSAMKSLSSNKDLKNILLNHSTLLSLLGNLITRYINNSSLSPGLDHNMEEASTNIPLKRDFTEENQNMKLILELLLQLYYHYEETNDFQLTFDLSEPYKLKELAQNIVNLTYHRKEPVIDFLARQLIARYESNEHAPSIKSKK